jgi:hypothetical protein
MTLVQEAEELIESAPLRMKWWCRPQVPLAHQTRRVAQFAQVIGQSLLRDRQSDTRFRISGSHRIRIEAKSTLISPRQQSSTGRRAVGGRDIPVGESCSTGRQQVDVGSRNLRAAVAAEFAVSQIINHHKQNVGTKVVRQNSTVSVFEDQRN